MGRASTKENKNYYQVCRESCGLTRAQAEEILNISDSRIEKIESRKTVAYPEEILSMAKVYKRPDLCNYYCTHECAIGMKTVNEVKSRDLSQIALEILATLNRLDTEKNRLIEITCDGRIDDEKELEDFIAIHKQLKRIGSVIDSLQLWIENTVARGEIDADELERLVK